MTEKITPKEVIQSYLLTVAKYDSNIYVKRILNHVISSNQDYLEGKKLNEVIDIEREIFENRKYKLDVKDILLSPTDKNYKRVYDAFDYLQSKFFLYEDEEIRFRVPFLNSVMAKKNNGKVEFSMSTFIYRAFTDYSKGFRKYELNISLSLSSVYSIRLYEFISGQKRPMTILIDDLKEMFEVQDKYKRINDFTKRVLEPAKKELDKKSPYTFDYELNKTGRAFTSITFYPKFQPQFRNDELEKKELQKQVSLSWDLPKEVTDYLINNFAFTKQGIKNNLDLFKQANQDLDLISLLAGLKGKIRSVSSPQAYVIGTLRKILTT